MSRVAKQSGRPLLNHRQQQHHLRGDDRERITSARRAAEALFTPNDILKSGLNTLDCFSHLPGIDVVLVRPRALVR
jgi:predicted ABC-class ATPase